MPFSGIIPPIATPLNGREEVDEPSLRSLVRYLLQTGVHGIFVLGSTGEFAHLTDSEKKRAIDIVVSEVNGKVPILVGVAEAGTKRSILWAKEAEKFGANGVVAAPPFYYPLTESEVENHYRALASECNLPILLYHIPSTTKVRFSVDLVERLSELPNIVGIKDSTGDLAFVFTLLDRMRGRDFAVFQGHDYLVAPSLLYGAQGAINSLANLVPSWFVAIYDAAQKGDAASAMDWQQKINKLSTQLETMPLLPAIKASLHIKGLTASFMTMPFAALTEEQHEKLRTILENEGVM
ncbi:MAG: dihydrodipicolinate synthase family protein [Armatimonadota bacterium]